jgi:hypothetical protein
MPELETVEDATKINDSKDESSEESKKEGESESTNK